MSDERSCILVVEDEEAIAAGLEYALEQEGYRVVLAKDGAEAIARFADDPDLVILDVMLPGRSGFEVLEALRGSGRTTPVIMLTARGQEADKVRGLDLGADDYVTKPFGLAELLARVRARLRRRPPGAKTLKLGACVIDLEAMTARIGEGAEERLSVREADMLRLLQRERGKPVSRSRFLDEVWGEDRFPTTRTVDQHVAKLRKKIEADPKNPAYLVTVFGLGYRLEA